jgi:flagellar assembly factor FliW
MNLSTKYFGDIEISEDIIVTFNYGIPGFPKETSFVFLPLAEGSPFTVMQSTATPMLAFITTSPFVFFKDYDFTISDQTVEQLQFESENDASVYVILTIKEPFEQSTANLVAPVLVNHEKKVAKQVVLEKTSYGVSHSVLPKAETIKGGTQRARTHAQKK